MKGGALDNVQSTRTEIRRRLALIQTRDSIRSCTGCELHKTAKAPVPVAGPLHARYMVVGQSPGQIEDHKGEPFTGPAGRLLKNLLTAHKLTPEGAAYMNVVSCIPHGPKDDRHAVTRGQIQACRGNVEAQLQAIDTLYLLVCGAVALATFMPNAELKWAKGGMYFLHGYWLMPIFHPSYVLKDARAKPDVEHCLDMFEKVVSGKFPPEWLRNNWCAYCGRELYGETPACMQHAKLWRLDKMWKKPQQEELL